MKRTPMKRTGFAPRVKPLPGILRTAVLARKAPISRGTHRMRARRLGKVKRTDAYLADMCHGQPCFILIPGVCINDPATVVPSHSNQARDGKGMGLKARDEKTCPGCSACHYEIDQGNRFTKAEKFAFWDAGYVRWVPVRTKQLESRK